MSSSITQPLRTFAQFAVKALQPLLDFITSEMDSCTAYCESP